MPYCIHRVTSAPPLTCDWYDSAWKGAETAELTHVRPESSDHRPKVAVRLLHDDSHVYGLFQVRDRFIRAVNIGYQAPVCKDSCVEFFFKPDVGPGYFNLEMSAGGSYLFYYVRDHQRTEEGFVDYSAVDEACGRLLTVKTTLPERIDPEIDRPLTWYAQFVIPVAALEPYCGKIGALGKRTWRGNFYKCGDDTSHPHWITWAPLTVLNYHLPECFDTLTLA
ncbi:MAG TPA: carbohydrate-binding family 9-like protein [Lentisphaeria bacterium]|nr:carbohydrate-binding family 9-like protein [Lentisphaeria bacterium]HQL88564.1 carbohydrate-binding family 9-like protein [Lentisphaeria bacterium]